MNILEQKSCAFLQAEAYVWAKSVDTCISGMTLFLDKEAQIWLKILNEKFLVSSYKSFQLEKTRIYTFITSF